MPAARSCPTTRRRSVSLRPATKERSLRPRSRTKGRPAEPLPLSFPAPESGLRTARTVSLPKGRERRPRREPWRNFSLQRQVTQQPYQTRRLAQASIVICEKKLQWRCRGGSRWRGRNSADVGETGVPGCAVFRRLPGPGPSLVGRGGIRARGRRRLPGAR
jgi:hypothetical protein